MPCKISKTKLQDFFFTILTPSPLFLFPSLSHPSSIVLDSSLFHALCQIPSFLNFRSVLSTSTTIFNYSLESFTRSFPFLRTTSLTSLHMSSIQLWPIPKPFGIPLLVYLSITYFYRVYKREPFNLHRCN